MKAIRFIGTLAVAGALAGCAGKVPMGPGAGVETPTKPVAEAPKAAPAPIVQTVPVAPRYEPVDVAVIPADPAPLPLPVPVPTYERVDAATPVLQTAPIESLEVVADYQPIGDLDAPLVSVAEPAPAYDSPTYEMIDDAAPLTPQATRAMAPIRDEPQDGRNNRRASNNEIRQHARKGYRRNAALRAGGRKAAIRSNFTPAFGAKLEQAALGRLNPSVRYDARYVSIGYPWGDVDETTGVCTDVIIRSYRSLGIDLQELVHEDMKRAFHAYPSKRIYGLTKPDPNIDHRRVVNLEAFFERTGAAIPIGQSPDDFQPGDVVTWRLSGNEPHIGIVVADRDPRSGYPLVVHNLGAGVRKDDLITLSEPVGHFRFAPDRQTVVAQLVTQK